MGFKDLTKNVLNNVKDNVNDKITEKKEDNLNKRQKKEEYDQEQKNYKNIFKTTTKIGDIEIDETNQLIKIHHAEVNIKKNSKMKTLGKSVLAMYTLGASLAIEYAMKPSGTIFRFDEIADFDLLENNNAIASGGLGRAIIGGTLLGGAGAIVGGITGKRKTKTTCDMLVVQISTTNMFFPNLMITYINKEIKKTDKKYMKELNNAQQTIAGLNSVIKIAENNKVIKVSVEDNNYDNNMSDDSYKELKELKELLDMGIINQEEFDIKKKELLGL